MFSSLLFFPIVGGFYFVSFFHHTRIRAKRADGYRLAFYALGAGLCLYVISLSLSALIMSVAEGWPPLLNLLRDIKGFFTVSGKYTAVWTTTNSPSDYQLLAGGITVILGVALSHGLNLLGCFKWFRILSEEKAVEMAIKERGDSIESFLFDALNSRETVLVTLDSNKVYIGQVYRNLNPAYELLSIELRIIKSGFRKPDDHTVSLTTDYDELVEMAATNLAVELTEQLAKSSKEMNDAELMSLAQTLMEKYKAEQPNEEQLVAIQFDRIQSIHPYNESVFEMHRSSLEKSRAENSKDKTI